MLELAFVLCLIDSDVCEDKELGPYIEVPLMQCMTQGQQIIGQWMADTGLLGTHEVKGGYKCRFIPEGERSI